MARPTEMSDDVQKIVDETARKKECELRLFGRTRLTTGHTARPRAAFCGLKGPGVQATTESEQARTNHIAGLKAMCVDSNQEASWQLCGYAATQCYDRLAEVVLRHNSVSSSITQRSPTQGAAYQTTRVNAKAIGVSAAAQIANVSVVLALAESDMQREYAGAKAHVAGVHVANPLATNASTFEDVCRLTADEVQCRHDARTCESAVSGTQLVHNSCPPKLSAVSIRSAAQTIAARELAIEYVSVAVGRRDHMLLSLCRSVSGGYEIDAVWAAVVLVVYLASDPRGRPLLNECGLTDLDVQIACTLELYGRAEITRRQNARREKETTASKRYVSTPDGKRKRQGRSAAAVSSSDPYGVLSWWFEGLRCEDAPVVQTLISNTKESARKAAQATLEQQAKGSCVAFNQVIQDLSAQNAVRSVKAMVPFVSRRVVDTPAIVAWKRPLARGGGFGIGISRHVHDGVASSLHALSYPPSVLWPCGSAIGVLHSAAAQELAGSDKARSVMPLVLETYGSWQQLRTQCQPQPRATASAERFVSINAHRALPSDISGLTRSLLVLRTQIMVHPHSHRCATQLVKEGHDLLHRVQARDFKSAYDCSTLLGVSQQADDRLEPLCTPCPKIGVAIRVCELLRRWMQGRSRKNEHVKVRVGPEPQEVPKETPAIMDSEPLPLLTITDMTMAHLSGGGRDLHAAPLMEPFNLKLFVCLEGAVRLPEALFAVPKLSHKRALLYAASSHASYIADVGGAISAGRANEAINSSKKICCPDVNTWLGTSAWDVYVGGLGNQERDFQGTPYSGTYTSRVDTGITGPGLMGHFYRSDRRQHGSMTLSEAAANSIALRLSDTHWVHVGDKHYVQAPAATRGIPHGFIVGVHSALAPLGDALEAVRAVNNREDCATTEGLFCLPLTPWTQALRPDIEATADSTTRHAFRAPEQVSTATGRSYLADATSEEEALLREPLFRRPCIAAASDNPWATSYDHMDGFFNAANALAIMALELRVYKEDAETLGTTAHNAVRDLWACIDTYHGFEVDIGGRRSSAGDIHGSNDGLAWASDACVILFGAIYPCSWGINEAVVPRGYAMAAAAQARRVHEDRGCTTLDQLGILPADLADCQRRWAAFRRAVPPDAYGTAPCTGRCAWHDGIGPLLEALAAHRGSHDVSLETVATVRARLEQAVRAAWLVHSADGVSPPPKPCPAAHCASPQDVRRPTLDPIFMHSDDLSSAARGALVGIKSFQWRQLCALLLASHLPDVVPQVVRNEGNLLLRTSSAADILEQDGSWRSVKSQSATQTESDGPAFGSLGSKLLGCDAQRKAWDANALLLAPAFSPVDPPLPAARRVRGEFGDASFAYTELHKVVDGSAPPPHECEQVAQNAMRRAAR